ncbi:MAG: mechanosensitive ion channel [Neisseria sp.]|nr:mechanosensitive ion channel [Neisseria sp.]
MSDFFQPRFLTMLSQEWAQFIGSLFMRQEFMARLIQRNFLTVSGLVEMVLALVLLLGTGYLVARWQRKNAGGTPPFHVYWLRRLQFPLLLLVGAVAAVFLWREFSGQRSVWFPLMIIAAPWMMVIRTATTILHYALSQNRFSAGAERFTSGAIWLAFVLWLSGIDDMMRRWAQSLVLPLGKGEISLYTIGNGLFWVLVVLVFALWVARLIENRLMNVDRIDLNLRIVLVKFVKSLLVLLAVLVTLPMIGIDLTVLSVFGGALGVGLGFGLQKIASNYVSGFIILLDHSIRLGDRLVVENFTGYVTRITSRYVVLRNAGGAEALVPNETFIANMVVNESFSSKKLSRSLPLQVAYATDLPLALDLMRQAAAKCPRVDKEQPPNAYLAAFADSGINLILTFWVTDPENGFMSLDSEILMEIWQKFQQHGIEFPFPQREIRIVGSEQAAAPPTDKSDDV